MDYAHTQLEASDGAVRDYVSGSDLTVKPAIYTKIFYSIPLGWALYVGQKMQNLSKLDIALVQLERAIVLALDDSDFISAVTLAGASEEILGSLLNLEDRQSSYLGLKRMLDYVHESVRAEKLSDKEFNFLANAVRNHFKHHCNEEMIEVEPEQEACNMIHRAISNYISLGHEHTKTMKRWLNECHLSPMYPIGELYNK